MLCINIFLKNYSKMKKILISFLFVSVYSFAQDYNTLSVGVSTGSVTEMGNIKSEGYSPLFSFDLSVISPDCTRSKIKK